MLTLTRDTKRLTIIIIYLFIFLFIGIGVFMLVRPQPTCFDGKQNQDERGVDCGGVCALVCVDRVVGNDVLVKEIAFVPGGEGKYDIVARIFNPNNDIGASNFLYALFLRDANGQELARSSGKSFILPQETKTLLALNVETTQVPVKAVIELADFEWTRFNEYPSKPELNIYSKRFIGKPDPSVFGAVVGTLVNESVYDFREIQLKIVLRDSAGAPIAANQSQMQTITVGREQDIRIVFPQPFAGTVAEVDIEAEANIYDEENFIRRYNVPKDRGSGL